MQSSGKSSPAAFAAMGTSECPVIPGDVFTSRNENEPSGRSMRSSRPQPAQPTMRNASSELAWISRSTASGRPDGQKYFVSSEKYLLW